MEIYRYVISDLCFKVMQGHMEAARGPAAKRGSMLQCADAATAAAAERYQFRAREEEVL